MKSIILQLNLFEIISLGIAILSIGANLYQYFTNKNEIDKLTRPLQNSLLALFNDIKDKKVGVSIAQMMTRAPNNPHTSSETVKWEYIGYLQNMTHNLNGFQETVAGLLVTLDPNDPEGKKTFRASNYGLSKDEIETQKLLATQMREKNFGPIIKNAANDHLNKQQKTGKKIAETEET